MQFDSSVWAVASVVLGVLAVALYVVCRWSEAEVTLSALDTVETVVGCMLGQGTQAEVKSTSGRLLLLTILMLQVLLMTYYTSGLTAGLALGPPLPSVSTIEDISSNPRLTLGWRKGAAHGETFRMSTIPAYRKIWDKVAANDMEALILTMEEAEARVLSKPYLMIASEISILHTFGQDCRIYILPNSFFPKQRSFVLRKGSPLIPILNKVMLDMWSTGLINKWWTKWAPAVKDCEQLETKAVEFKTLLTILIVLSVSLALSLVFLLAETFVWRRRRAGQAVLGLLHRMDLPLKN